MGFALGLEPSRSFSRPKWHEHNGTSHREHQHRRPFRSKHTYPKELELISKVKERHLQYGFIGCTKCRYCMPCPQGVKIPEILAFYDEFLRSPGGETKRREIMEKYQTTVPSENRANTCIKCGTCEEKCPQSLPIRKFLSEVQFFLENIPPPPPPHSSDISQ